MNKLFYFIIVIIFLNVFQSCIREHKTPEIETYQNKKIIFEEIDKFLKTQMDSLAIPAISIAIINDGKIAYHNALGVKNIESNKIVNENTIFEAASLSKPIFAFFVMKLSEKGIIDLNRPLHYYLPDSEMERDERYKEVSARMVLSHKSGFPNWRWFSKPPEKIKINRGDFFMINEPNTTFNYSGEAYQYLARVIAHLNFVNMNELNEIFQNEVAKPLGIEHAYFVWDDYLSEHLVASHKNGKPRKLKWETALPYQNSKIFSASGGLRTEAKSYAKFLISIINKKGLSTPTYNKMLSPSTEITKDNVNFTEDRITNWSLGFGLKPMQNDTIFRHGGSSSGAQSEFAFSINKKYGYVFFGNCEKGNEFNEKLEEFLEMNQY
jgi:CubicO group peptidase (beta-lactamase class C family)